MTRNISRVTRKGQVTIPVEIRRDLGIHEGDRIEFVRNNGTITIKPAEPAESRRITEAIERLPADSVVRRTVGILSEYAKRRPMSDEERHIAEEEAIVAGWTERERRYQSQRNTDE
jgi:AbrB family looped-hinge helix DNA binding protein